MKESSTSLSMPRCTRKKAVMEADAINGKGELYVKPEQVRDVLRTIELARESHEKGVTVAWK